jgi:hypothetical protein
MSGPPVDKNEDVNRMITVVDEVSFIWKQADGKIPVGLRRHAQMYFLPCDIPAFDNDLEILSEAMVRREPVRLTFREHGGEVLSVDRATADDKTDS